VVKDVQQLV